MEEVNDTLVLNKELFATDNESFNYYFDNTLTIIKKGDVYSSRINYCPIIDITVTMHPLTLSLKINNETYTETGTIHECITAISKNIGFIVINEYTNWKDKLCDNCSIYIEKKLTAQDIELINKYNYDAVNLPYMCAAYVSMKYHANYLYLYCKTYLPYVTCTYFYSMVTVSQIDFSRTLCADTSCIIIYKKGYYIPIYSDSILFCPNNQRDIFKKYPNLIGTRCGKGIITLNKNHPDYNTFSLLHFSTGIDLVQQYLHNKTRFRRTKSAATKLTPY